MEGAVATVGEGGLLIRIAFEEPSAAERLAVATGAVELDALEIGPASGIVVRAGGEVPVIEVVAPILPTTGEGRGPLLLDAPVSASVHLLDAEGGGEVARCEVALDARLSAFVQRVALGLVAAGRDPSTPRRAAERLLTVSSPSALALAASGTASGSGQRRRHAR